MSAPVPIGAQVLEVEREIRMRAGVYPKRIAAGHLTQGDADAQTAAMRAALATLQIVDRHADGLRLLLRFLQRKLAERDGLTGLPKPLAARMPDDTETELLLQQPAVRAVLEAFPGATIAGVTTPWTPT